MNDMIASNPNDVIRAARAQIIANAKTKAHASGHGHGVIVGAHAKAMTSATIHTTHKATVATTSYARGFGGGFLAGWKG